MKVPMLLWFSSEGQIDMSYYSGPYLFLSLENIKGILMFSSVYNRFLLYTSAMPLIMQRYQTAAYDNNNGMNNKKTYVYLWDPKNKRTFVFPTAIICHSSHGFSVGMSRREILRESLGNWQGICREMAWGML